jgi:hypothetical protein
MQPSSPHPHRRPRRRNIFNERDLARAVRAAQRAGGVARVEVSSDDGTITLLLGEPPKDHGVMLEAEPTPLEQWRAKRSGES